MLEYLTDDLFEGLRWWGAMIQARVAVEATTPQVALVLHEQERLTPCVQVAIEGSMSCLTPRNPFPHSSLYAKVKIWD